MVTIGDDLEISNLAKVICAAFEGIENSKHQENETEEADQDVRRVG